MQITVPFATYPHLRFSAVFAGTIGVMQSVAWFSMAIIAIIGYNCNINFEGTGANYGSLLITTLYHMYFQGDCPANNFPPIDFQPIDGLELVTPLTINIWMWVVMSISFVWLLSSLTLIMNVKKSHLKYANAFIYSWIFMTIVVSMIDLVLFILFALDYDTIFSHSLGISLDYAVPSNVVLITAQNSAGMMMSVALRGYVLWLINLALAVYLFTQTFKIYDYNKLSEQRGIVTGNSRSGGQVNNAFVHNELAAHSIYKNQPIQAFEPTGSLPWYNYLTTDIPRPKPQPPPPVLVRSTSSSGLEEEFNKRMTQANTMENKNTFNSEVVLRREHQAPSAASSRQSSNLNNLHYTQTPQPQFETRPPLKSGILRNSRYQ